MKVDERYLNAIDAKLALERSDGLAYTENLGSVDPYWDDKWVAKTLRDLVGAVRERDQTIESLRAENAKFREALEFYAAHGGERARVALGTGVE